MLETSTCSASGKHSHRLRAWCGQWSYMGPGTPAWSHAATAACLSLGALFPLFVTFQYHLQFKAKAAMLRNVQISPFITQLSCLLLLLASKRLVVKMSQSLGETCTASGEAALLCANPETSRAVLLIRHKRCPAIPCIPNAHTVHPQLHVVTPGSSLPCQSDRRRTSQL